MALSLWVVVVIVLVIIYLIFKFIKKVIWAVICVILLLLLVISGLAGLVYVDYNYFVNQENYDLKVIQVNEDESILGVNIPVVNSEFMVDDLSPISQAELDTLDYENLNSDDGYLVVTIEEELFDSLIQDEYNLADLGTESESVDEIVFTSDDVREILDSNDPVEVVVDIFLDSAELSDFERALAEPLVETEVEESLGDEGIKEMVFILVLSQAVQDDKKVIEALDGFKQGTVNVYPDRPSFNLLKTFLPTETISDAMSSEE